MKTPNHLAQMRKKFSLSQKDIATLLDVHDATVCRVEAGAVPSLLFALGCEFLFGESLAAFFPSALTLVREAALERLADFSQLIEHERGEAAERRQRFLQEIVDREDYGITLPRA